MEKYPLAWKKLFSTPLLEVFDFLLQHPEIELSDTEIASKLSRISKSAVNEALKTLAHMHLTERKHRGRLALNRLLEMPIIHHFKIISNLFLLQTITEQLKEFCALIILFGSRASGEHLSTSDIDLFIVTEKTDETYRALNRMGFEAPVSAVVKSAHEWLTLSQENPALYHAVKKGMMLWERT